MHSPEPDEANSTTKDADANPPSTRPAGLAEAHFPAVAWEKAPGELTLREIVARLRAPDGCPWDREQTHASLTRHLREEAAEVIDAIDAGDIPNLREELGDLLLQVVLHSQIAAEAGEFNLDEVEREICEKLVRRHPHVFGDGAADTSAQVLQRWEEIKQEEKRGKIEAHTAVPSVLDGVPRALPALARSQKLQVKAARTGYEWVHTLDVLTKLEEEVAELREAFEKGAALPELEDELGDVLFVAAGFARRTGLDAETAMEHAITKFRARFGHMEALARAQGVALEDLTREQWQAFWQSAKDTLKPAAEL